MSWSFCMVGSDDGARFSKAIGSLAEDAPQLKDKMLVHQTTDECAGRPPVGGSDVREDAAVGGHGERRLFCHAMTLPSRGRTERTVVYQALIMREGCPCL